MIAKTSWYILNTKISWEAPIKTISEANCSEHWSVKSKRHKEQQLLTRAGFALHVEKLQLPCKITLTRLAPGTLDDGDNLPMAFKWIKDQLSDCIFPQKIQCYISKTGKIRSLKGRTDSDSRITWEFKQEKKKGYGVRFEISF